MRAGSRGNCSHQSQTVKRMEDGGRWIMPAQYWHRRVQFKTPRAKSSVAARKTSGQDFLPR